MPIGPGDRELCRMRDTLAMLAHHEPVDDLHLVLVDDDPVPRDLDPGWPHHTILRTELRRRRRPDNRSAMTAATLTGLELCKALPVDGVVKLDTDVAIAAPFVGKIRRAFSDSRLGVVGSYDVTCTGTTRDWSVWHGALSRADRRLSVTRRPDGARVLWAKRGSDVATVRRQRALACARLPAGAHCLGGAYAVSRAFLDRVDLAWRPWVGTGLAEDVVVGMLCGAAGLEMKSLTRAQEPFALAWRGLPGTPQEIVAAGHSIVHSVKAETVERERELRAALASAAGIAEAAGTAETAADRAAPA